MPTLRGLVGSTLNRLRPLRSRLLDVLVGPGKFYCGVCGRPVRSFEPLPSFYETILKDVKWPYTFDQAETCNFRHYLCPRCSAADRDRLIVLFLTEVFAEIPPGEGRTWVQFAPMAQISAWIKRAAAERNVTLNYRTADLFDPDVDDTVDITDLKVYATESLDLFICSHVLEHVADDRKALAELHRVLKKGGKGVLLVPIILGLKEIDEDPSVTDPEERWRRFGQDDHVRLYSKEGFVSRVRDAGFRVHELGVAHFGADTFVKQGITSQSVLYVAEKPSDPRPQ